MIDKFNKGSDLFFQIKTFLRNYPFRPPLFPLTPPFYSAACAHPLPRCALRPPFAHALLLFPPRCALGPPFAHAPLLFPPRCAIRPSRAHGKAGQRTLRRALKTHFTTGSCTIIIGSRSTSFCQSPGVHSGTRIQAGYTVARCSQSYCRSHRRSGYDRKSNNRHRCSR